MEERTFSTLGLALMEAAFDGTPLRVPILALSRALGGETALLYLLRSDTWNDVQSTRLLPEDVLDEYRSYPHAVNPLLTAWDRMTVDRAADFEPLAPYGRLARGPLKAMIDNVGFPSRHALGLRLRPLPGYEARFSLGSNGRRGGFGADALRALDALAGSVSAAIRARYLLGHRTAGESLLCERDEPASLDALEVLPAPLALLDQAPRLLHANAALRALVARRDGLVLAETRLAAAHRGADQALSAMIEAMARGGAAMQPLHTGIAVPRIGGRRPYLVQAYDLRGARSPSRGLLLAVTDPDGASATPETIGRLLGLTQAESVLAATLAAGATLAEAASERRIGLETARSQLKAILAKTGCARQADLARLLARLGRGSPG